MRAHKSLFMFIGVSIIFLLLYAPDSFAYIDATHERFTGILDAFKNQSIRWQGGLTLAARWLFFTLAIIQFVYTNFMLALKGGDGSDFISQNTKQILGIGVMYVFLMHSFSWSHAIVKGFLQAGERAVLASAGITGSPIDPANVFENGLSVAGSLFSQMSIWSGSDNLTLVLCALVLIACFAFLAAFMTVVVVESYIIIGGAVLFLGFGGSSWTSDIAKKSMMYAVSVGAKLFVMQLIVGVAMGSVVSWSQTYEQTSSTSTFSLIGLVVMITICAKQIPELVQGILSGVSTGGSSAMVGSILAATAAATAGAAAAGAIVGGGAAAGAGGASAVGSGAQGAAYSTTGVFSNAGGHMARMGGHILETGSGINPNSAFGPLSSASRSSDDSNTGSAYGSGQNGGTDLDVGNKPTPPGTSPLASSAAVSGDGTPTTGTSTGSIGTGGTISGSGVASKQGSKDAAVTTSSNSPKNQVSQGSATDTTTPNSIQLEKSGEGSGPQSIDERVASASSSSNASAQTTVSAPPYTDTNSTNLASSQLANGVPDAPNTTSGFGGGPQSLDDRADANKSTDAASSFETVVSERQTTSTNNEPHALPTRSAAESLAAAMKRFGFT